MDYCCAKVNFSDKTTESPLMEAFGLIFLLNFNLEFATAP